MAEAMASEPVVGVALGGGAARGLAHIGVLRALEEIGIRPGVIGGTSFGALVGALYAWQGSAEQAERSVRGFLASPEFVHMRLRFLKPEAIPPAGSLFYSFSNLVKKGIVLGYSVARPSFVSAEEFAGYIAALLPDLHMDELAVPLVVVAADLNTGLEVTINRGALRPAVAGSCAIPGLLPPAPVDGRLLIDGGWVNKVPVRPVRSMGADLVIAVDVSVELEDTSGFKRGLNIMTRANAIAANRLREMQVAEADVVVRPQVSGIHWADFTRLDQAIELGREAVREVRADLEAGLARRRQLQAMRAFAARDRAEP